MDNSVIINKLKQSNDTQKIMSKITDLNEIQAQATEILNASSWEILDYLTVEEASTALTMIYVTNDLTTGFAQDYSDNISLLTSPTRVAVIFLGHHSFYKPGANLCTYENLYDDLYCIALCIDAALARWSELSD